MPGNHLDIFLFQGAGQLGDGFFQGSEPLRGRVDLASSLEFRV